MVINCMSAALEVAIASDMSWSPRMKWLGGTAPPHAGKVGMSDHCLRGKGTT